MAKRGYKLKISADMIRFHYKPNWHDRIVTLLLALLVFLGLLQSPDVMGFVICTLFYASIAIAALLLSGEVLVISPRSIEYAHRKWNHWSKERASSAQVRLIRRKVVSSGRSYTDYLGVTTDGLEYDWFKDAPITLLDDIVQSAAKLGYAIPPVDRSTEAMMKDIHERGWFVNPLKPDPPMAKND